MTTIEASSNEFVVNPADIQAAATRIAPHVLRTPSIHSESLSKRLGCQVWFKPENLQHTGAFKTRGAVNAVMSLSEEEASKGVVTHSSGNHAAALARAATIRGIEAHVVMPKNSSRKKIDAVRSFGVEPIFCETSSQARSEMAEKVREKTGAAMVHPINDPRVIAGQGTVASELVAQIDGLDAVLVPVGGGGLISGILMLIKSLHPHIKVYAVEPALADDTARSLKAGHREMPVRYDTIADGLRSEVGVNTFPIIRHFVDDLFLVDEVLIGSAMRTLAEDAHLVAEPSGAVSFAGLISMKQQFAGKTVAAVITGGNMDFGECKLGRNRISS